MPARSNRNGGHVEGKPMTPGEDDLTLISLTDLHEQPGLISELDLLESQLQKEADTVPVEELDGIYYYPRDLESGISAVSRFFPTSVVAEASDDDPNQPFFSSIQIDDAPRLFDSGFHS